MSVQIIVDSTADLTGSCRKQCKIVPLTVHFGEEEFLDGVTLDRQSFYERLAASGILPTTSQPAPAAFETVFQEVAQAGDSAVVITISSRLSGTYQSACIAADEFDNIFVVDSRTTAIGAGVLVEYALRCAESGMSAQELAAHLEAKREDVRLVALLDTLEYLRKGGRISSTAAFAGTLLSIKPVITLVEGEVVLIGKARGAKQGRALLTEKIRESGTIDMDLPILFGYTGVDNAGLQQYLAEEQALWSGAAQPLNTTQVCSVIGTHTGPGVVAAAYFKK